MTETRDGVTVPASASEAIAGRHVRVPSSAVIGAELRAADIADVALHLFDELPSTNRWLETHVGRVDEPRVLCAVDLQSAGAGRRGRGWVSARGDVACSLLERLPIAPAQLSGLSLVTGIAVANALRESSGLDVRIKWPNDLVVDGAKIGGLLTWIQARPETEALVEAGAGEPGVATALVVADGDRPRTVVISGIGINVAHDARLATLGIGGTSLETLGAAAVERDALIGRIAARVFAAHARFVREGWAAFADAWCPLDWLVGREIDILGKTGTERARALGVNADGALRAETGGVERVLYGGEVSVRPHPRAVRRGCEGERDVTENDA